MGQEGDLRGFPGFSRPDPLPGKGNQVRKLRTETLYRKAVFRPGGVRPCSGPSPKGRVARRRAVQHQDPSRRPRPWLVSRQGRGPVARLALPIRSHSRVFRAPRSVYSGLSCRVPTAAGTWPLDKERTTVTGTNPCGQAGNPHLPRVNSR